MLGSDATLVALPVSAGGSVTCLLPVGKGFLSCHIENMTIKRWSPKKCSYNAAADGVERRAFKVVGLHEEREGFSVERAIERDDDTFVTAQMDDLLRLWDTATCKSLQSISLGEFLICSLLKTKDKTHIICGSSTGLIEIRDLYGGFGLVSAFDLKDKEATMPCIIYCMCLLEDGTFIAAVHNKLKRCDWIKGYLLQTLVGHSDIISEVIELKKDVIVSASFDRTVKIWRLSTDLYGECLHTLTQHSAQVNGLVKLSEGCYFATGSIDQTIRVWDDNGNNVITYRSELEITTMTRLRDGSIVVGGEDYIEIRM